MNWGLSELKKADFITFSPVERPKIKTNNISDPNWLAGYTSGDGHFGVSIIENKTHKIGYQVQLRFRIKTTKEIKNYWN